VYTVGLLLLTSVGATGFLSSGGLTSATICSGCFATKRTIKNNFTVVLQTGYNLDLLLGIITGPYADFLHLRSY
jgi:hypothetical protein